MLGIHQGKDPVKTEMLLHVVIREESLRNWRWICQASRLDDDAVEWLALARRLLVQLLEARDEVASHGTADATVVHLDHVLLRHAALRVQELVVDADLAELVLDHSNLFTVVLLEDVVEQRRLSGAEEARDDRRRGLGLGRGLRGLIPEGLDVLLALLKSFVVWEQQEGCPDVDDGPLLRTQAGEELGAHRVRPGKLLLLGRVQDGHDLLQPGLGYSQDVQLLRGWRVRMAGFEVLLVGLEGRVYALHAIKVPLRRQGLGGDLPRAFHGGWRLAAGGQRAWGPLPLSRPPSNRRARRS
mmetsp:Transcript_3127/g.8040  ORF Transcript_3127/g.8040 Transcript_3127/m.8040 type:complete len:298 (-) Transcript_3127:21-914(-)